MHREQQGEHDFTHRELEAMIDTVIEGQTHQWSLVPGQKEHSEAAFQLGNRHFAAKEANKAIRWYERAANAGHVVAQYNLGLIYLKGEDVPWDGAKGLRWMKKAAKGGDLRAQALLRRIAPMYMVKGDRAA